jgi:hypothetical protein
VHHHHHHDLQVDPSSNSQALSWAHISSFQGPPPSGLAVRTLTTTCTSPPSKASFRLPRLLGHLRSTCCKPVNILGGEKRVAQHGLGRGASYQASHDCSSWPGGGHHSAGLRRAIVGEMARRTSAMFRDRAKPSWPCDRRPRRGACL